MGKLDVGQSNRRAPERLEASHRSTPAFDRPVILLNQVVKVLATPHLNILSTKGRRGMRDYQVIFSLKVPNIPVHSS